MIALLKKKFNTDAMRPYDGQLCILFSMTRITLKILRYFRTVLQL
jgi:hypothetical protein